MWSSLPGSRWVWHIEAKIEQLVNIVTENAQWFDGHFRIDAFIGVLLGLRPILETIYLVVLLLLDWLKRNRGSKLKMFIPPTFGKARIAQARTILFTGATAEYVHLCSFSSPCFFAIEALQTSDSLNKAAISSYPRFLLPSFCSVSVMSLSPPYAPAVASSMHLPLRK